MSLPLEDYALIGDCHTAALVSRRGSIDWLCLPRFDSGAVFAALLGSEDHGHWQIEPAGAVTDIRRAYRDASLILETTFASEEGEATLVDFMPPRRGRPQLVRLVRGRRGQVPMRMHLTIRCDYGSIVPWVTRTESGIRAVAGPDGLLLLSDVEMHGEDFSTVAEFTVSAGEELRFVLLWYPSYEREDDRPKIDGLLAQTEAFWRDWAARCGYQGPWRDAVVRSLITLKALTYEPTGGIVAAPTTSLPEKLGGVRNWDYRYCWVRDATFTLDALLASGYTQEAAAWRDWLLRAVAGKPSDLNIMYGVAGERRLPEIELAWLPGYENSRPVRIGNAAHRQFQLDVYGELIDTIFQGQKYNIQCETREWRLARALVEFLETAWKEPDEGIWEVRGPRRHFTHSKVMAWVAFDRMVKMVERFGLGGPADRWRRQREEIRREVCAQGVDPRRNCFVQYYGGTALDASLLMIPLVGFLPADDPRMLATVRAIERELTRDEFVQRYPTDPQVDGLPPGEGAFLACTFWLVDNLALLGERDKAIRKFEWLLALRNDVGLLSEEYDPQTKRLVGNFPQAFSHVALVESALNLQASEPLSRRLNA